MRVDLDELDRLLSKAPTPVRVAQLGGYVSSNQARLLCWLRNNAQAMRDELLELREQQGNHLRHRPECNESRLWGPHPPRCMCPGCDAFRDWDDPCAHPNPTAGCGYCDPETRA